MGLAGLLTARGNDLVGILNGIDIDVWNPAEDPFLTLQFNVESLAGRAVNKAAMQRTVGLEVNPERLLFGVVSRLSWQKGLDLLVETLPTLQAIGAQLALIGTGDRMLQDAFAAAAAKHPGDIGVMFGYDEALAHQLQGSVDALLVPSRFEPCGLTQLCALRYGALPVVSRVGGLADTVRDVDLAGSAGTGVQFSPVTATELATALHRTADLWQEPNAWLAVQQNAMRQDVSWDGPAAQYAALYREIAALRAV
jgi:starch synthase